LSPNKLLQNGTESDKFSTLHTPELNIYVISLNKTNRYT